MWSPVARPGPDRRRAAGPPGRRAAGPPGALCMIFGEREPDPVDEVFRHTRKGSEIRRASSFWPEQTASDQ
ncbi:hypothetical protein FRACA_2890008 [Frankia canadensis]|uniref:Uncharacterized protein n=1 Tax=Frankia canadensis TaxID=1836972 RepID=A0A2I2KT99_9ACTN|nr:hypothetical protein FRACA_2890008 [Frankia canadensis]SOU56175.1 hypothetical protein FRACA_2890008 [Frankia canadensis]